MTARDRLRDPWRLLTGPDPNATTDWLHPGPLALLLWPIGCVLCLLDATGWRAGERPGGARTIRMDGKGGGA